MSKPFDWAKVVLAIAVLALGVSLGVLFSPKEGTSQQCFAALQLRLAETPTDERAPIPDDELDRVCPGWERFSTPYP